VRLSDAPVEYGCLAKVIDIVPTGGSWIVELSVNGEQYFAIAADAPSQKADDDIWFYVERAHVHVFDNEGKRIAAD